MQKIQLSDYFTYSRLPRFTIPSITMMIFTSICGVLDGIFASNFAGKAPFAAVNPIMTAVKQSLAIRSWSVICFGSSVVAFGLYHIHSFSGVTEGGALGLNLLLEHWFSLSPAITNLVVNGLCYLLGWRMLGKQFLFRSAIAAGSFSLAYALFERFAPLWPHLYRTPLLAAVLGALFVGVGTGLCVRHNAAICGDDALAMSLSHLTGLGIQWIYLTSDLTVLGLSMSYIPLSRLGCSVLTVFLSGQIIGLFQPRTPPEITQTP